MPFPKDICAPYLPPEKIILQIHGEKQQKTRVLNTTFSQETSFLVGDKNPTCLAVHGDQTFITPTGPYHGVYLNHRGTSALLPVSESNHTITDFLVKDAWLLQEEDKTNLSLYDMEADKRVGLFKARRRVQSRLISMGSEVNGWVLASEGKSAFFSMWDNEKLWSTPSRIVDYWNNKFLTVENNRLFLFDVRFLSQPTCSFRLPVSIPQNDIQAKFVTGNKVAVITGEKEVQLRSAMNLCHQRTLRHAAKQVLTDARREIIMIAGYGTHFALYEWNQNTSRYIKMTWLNSWIHHPNSLLERRVTNQPTSPIHYALDVSQKGVEPGICLAASFESKEGARLCLGTPSARSESKRASRQLSWHTEMNQRSCSIR